MFQGILKEEMARIGGGVKSEAVAELNFKIAGDLLDSLVISGSFPEFMTLLAYNYLS